MDTASCFQRVKAAASKCRSPSIQDPGSAVMPSILLVEDDPLIQILHQQFLTPFKCDVASTGRQAVKMAKEHTYELILMDIGLPDMSGIEVIKLLRLEHKNKYTRIAIITAQPEDCAKSNDLNIEKVIPKPISPQTLMNLVLGILDK